MSEAEVNHWYAAKPTEIFVDLDSRRSLYRAMRVLKVVLSRKGGIFYGLGCDNNLSIKNLWYFETQRKGHGHLILDLHEAMAADLRALWALWLGSDRLRGVYVQQRIRRGLEAHADLLVAHQGYHRMPDQTCYCAGKHKSKRITDNCPALLALLGDQRSADYFPRAGRRHVKAFRVPLGRISKRSIVRWESHAKNGTAKAGR